MRLHRVILSTLILFCFTSPGIQGQSSARNQMRFAAMDVNNDGVVTRREWQGSAASFREQDWNDDGILSGDEVRPGARRPAQAQTRGEANALDPDDDFDDWTAEGFTRLDRNRDGEIARNEWNFSVETFRRADHDNDGRLNRGEFLGTGTPDTDDREQSFRVLDDNGDGRISRREWAGTRARFDALDDNRDGVLTSTEAAGSLESPAEVFTRLDVNRDRRITLDEWHGSPQGFEARDTNRDRRLTPQELTGTGSSSRRARAESGLPRRLRAGADRRPGRRTRGPGAPPGL